MNKELLKEYLSSRYQGWSSFLHNVIFPIFGEDDFENGFETELLESQPERKQLAEATGIRSIKQVGMIYVGVEPLHIFDVTVNDRVMMERNRVNIQRLIRTVMDQYSCAFMLFHYEDDTRWDWRFTYCRKAATKKKPPIANDIRSCWVLVNHAARQLTISWPYMTKGILLKLKTSKMHSMLKLFLKSFSGSTRLNMRLL